MFRRIVLMAMALLAVCAVGVAEKTYELPMDLSPGQPLIQSNYITDTDYVDPTIEMHVITGHDADTDWWMGDVVIKHPSQLRTMPAYRFTSSSTIRGGTLSYRANAVLAVNGDYFCVEVAHKGSFVLRQGEMYAQSLIGASDILYIDEAGDFHVAYKPLTGEIPEEIDGKKIVNGLCFGPVLVDNGQPLKIKEDPFMATEQLRARVAICQIGPLHYAIVVCSGPAYNSKGMTLQEFADLLGTLNVQCAYNLDGGNSAMMFTGGKMININRSTREISDIVYFASAWPGEGDQ